MPFKDPEDRRRYDRERKRLLRSTEAARAVVLAPPVRLRVAQDVEALLAEAARLARSDPRARGVERARALTQVAAVALRLVEAHRLQERVEALEQVLRARSA
jgi:hypothetical protein